MKQRTAIQKEADNVDCDLYRLLMRLERLYDGYKRYEVVRAYLGPALNDLRAGRSKLRLLMHKDDLKGTEG
jgi:uncharacterized protein YcbK (DUF882 family)